MTEPSYHFLPDDDEAAAEILRNWGQPTVIESFEEDEEDVPRE